MARAVSIPRPGGPEVLEVIDRPVREPAAGEIRIHVRYAAVNPTDIMLRKRGDATLRPPWTPGMDAAGTIELLGEGVEHLQLGDEVMAVCTPRRPDGGAQCELLVVPAASAVLVGSGTSLAAAATLPMNGLTAIVGLELLGLSAGQTLAVSGGAGLLASYVIPLAVARGLRVIADAAPADAEPVAGFGAEEVVPRSADFAAAVRAVVPGGVDGVYDTAVLAGAALGAIRDDGALAVVRGWEGGAERGITVHPVQVRSALERTDWLQELATMVDEGRIALRPLDAYPPEHAAQAQERMDAGGLRGRLLIAF